MNSEDHLDALLHEAKNRPQPLPSSDLVARVLADAVAEAPLPNVMPNRPKPSFLKRLLSPIGGYGGAFALTACAVFGVLIGADFGDTLASIPGFDTVLATLTVDPDTTTPFETLSYLMSES